MMEPREVGAQKTALHDISVEEGIVQSDTQTCSPSDETTDLPSYGVHVKRSVVPKAPQVYET